MARTGRPRDFDEDTVVARVTDLFWRRGYGATSVQDLVDAAGVQRGSLYQTFGSKEGLLLRALAHYRAYVVDRLSALDDGPVLPALRAFLAIPLVPRTSDLGRGCLLGRTAFEVSEDDDRVVAAVREGYDTLEEILRGALERAYDRGELPRRDARADARLLMVVQQGLQVVARTARHPDDLLDAVDTTLDTLRRTGP